MQNGNGGVPKLIFGPKWVVPEVGSAEELDNVLREVLGVGR
jgi:hypothetical protein